MSSFHLLNWQEIQSVFWEPSTPNHCLMIVHKPQGCHPFWRAEQGPFHSRAHVVYRPVALLLLCQESTRLQAGGPFSDPPVVPGHGKKKSPNIHHSWNLQKSGPIPASGDILKTFSSWERENNLFLSASFSIAQKKKKVKMIFLSHLLIKWFMLRTHVINYDLIEIEIKNLGQGNYSKLQWL